MKVEPSVLYRLQSLGNISSTTEIGEFEYDNKIPSSSESIDAKHNTMYDVLDCRCYSIMTNA